MGGVVGCFGIVFRHGEMEEARKLLLLADVGDGDPESHGFLSDVTETCFVEHRDHLFATKEGIDGSGKILVCAGTIASDKGGCSGHDVFEVEVVPGSEDGVSGEGEFEDTDSAAGPENAIELCDGLFGFGDVADAECDGDDVDGLIGKRELCGVAVAEGNRRLDTWMSGLPELFFVVGDDGHLVREVEADDACGGLPGKGEGEVARAACDIEHGLGRFRLGEFDGFFSPGLVAPEGVDTVVDVVGSSDGGEHFTDALGFVGGLVGVIT